MNSISKKRFEFPRFITTAEREKLKSYDLLESNISGLRNALETQQRALDDAHQRLTANEEKARKLQQEYAQLQGKATQAASNDNEALLIDLFRRLQPVAVQLPTVRASIGGGAQVSGRDVLGLVAPIEAMLRDLGFETIGEVNQNVSFDPRLHQSTGQQSPSHGETVRVRYVGYRFKDQILCRAEVARDIQTETA